VICSCCCKIDRSAGGIDADGKLRRLWTVCVSERTNVSCQQLQLYCRFAGFPADAHSNSPPPSTADTSIAMPFLLVRDA
jgi:hypothetical protein